MADIYNTDGKLIATIHDPEGFAQLLDNFEKEIRIYVQLLPPQEVDAPFNYVVNDALLNVLTASAMRLREIRKNFGDFRDNLYPIGKPPEDQPE